MPETIHRIIWPFAWIYGAGVMVRLYLRED